MAVNAKAVVVTDAAAVVISAPTVPAGRRRVYLRTDAEDDAVYLGGPDVTDQTGVPLLADDLLVPIELGENDTLYGICAESGTATVHVLTT